MDTFSNIELPLEKIYSGKVRELYEVNEYEILLVATDRVSAFDFVLPTPIPGKGEILTQISVFWFHHLEDIIKNHLVKERFEDFPESLKSFSFLKNRSVIVKKAERISIECVVRGYVAGGGWKEYEKTGKICGVQLQEGLKMGEKLPEPIFTPATKEEKGMHDRNISFEETKEIVGEETARLLKEKSISLYQKASLYAEEKGIIIADTKFEFGYSGNEIILIDEVFTPDSSRFWEKSKYKIGQIQESLDKQYIRDYLESLSWDKNPPVPSLPDDVVENTTKKYNQIYHILTGK